MPERNRAGRTRYEEYLICRDRGHTPSNYRTASNPPQNVCERCGTYYWYERVFHEHSQPEPDDSNTDREPQ